ncbi:MAG: DUF2470 domain-containing protein [Myxococcota bacterium]
MPDPSMLQEVDDGVRREAKNLARCVRYGALGLLRLNDGRPWVSRVGIATDTDGAPIFPVSSLSGRVPSMTEDGRASLLLGEPGRGDPLAHPRLTLNGHLVAVEKEVRDRIRRRYLARHPAAELYIDFEDFSMWRLEVESASYIAGFGRAYRLVADDLRTAFADWPAWHAMEPGAVEHMNDDHTDATELYATVFCGASPGAWRITGLDPEGVDLALDDDHRRVSYDAGLKSAEELRPKLVALVREARAVSK